MANVIYRGKTVTFPDDMSEAEIADAMPSVADQIDATLSEFESSQTDVKNNEPSLIDNAKGLLAKSFSDVASMPINALKNLAPEQPKMEKYEPSQPSTETNSAFELAQQPTENLLNKAKTDARLADEYANTLRAPEQPEANLVNIVKGVASSLPQGAETTRQGIRTQFFDAIGSEDMLSDAQLKAKRNSLEMESTTPAFETETAQGLYSGATSLIQQIPGMAAAIASGNPLPALANAGLMTEAEAYSRYRERGATPQEAITGAMGEGITEVLTEMIPMSFLVKKFGKTGASEIIGGFIARDAIPEQVATLTQDAIDTAIANPDKTWGEYLEERPSAAYQTLLATVVQGGAIGGANFAVKKLSENTGDRLNVGNENTNQDDLRAQELQAQYDAKVAQEEAQQAEADEALVNITNPNTTVDEAIDLAKKAVDVPVNTENTQSDDALLREIEAATSEAIPASDILEDSNVSDIEQGNIAELDNGTVGTEFNNGIGSAIDTVSQFNDTLGSAPSLATIPNEGRASAKQLRGAEASNVGETDLPASVDKDWVDFSPETGTLNIPRAEMPQIKAEHRGAMVNFLNARDVAHESENVPAASLKPTQREFSLEKVQKAIDFEGGNRSILVSSDNHVVDGHHQWLASLNNDENIDIIRLNAPIKELLPLVKEFPSSETDKESDAKEINVKEKKKYNAGSTLQQKLAGLGGISFSDLQDITGEKTKSNLKSYSNAFKTKSNKSLKGIIESGDLDEFLPPAMRLETNGMNDEAFDSTEAYDYLSERIRNGEKVLPYDIEQEAIMSEAYANESLQADINTTAEDDGLDLNIVNSMLKEAGYDEVDFLNESKDYETRNESSVGENEVAEQGSANSDITGSERNEVGTPTTEPTAGQATARNEVAETPRSDEREGVRPLVESIVKRRAAANQINKSKAFDNYLGLAKDFLNGKEVSPSRFKLAATELKNDAPLAEAFNKLAELAKSPAKETRATKANTLELFNQQIAEAKTADELRAIAKGIQEESALSDAQVQELDDAVMGKMDALDSNETTTNNVDDNKTENVDDKDLLGDNTTAKQAVADAQRDKDAKRNTGKDDADNFTLTGSNSEADVAAANGAQDLFGGLTEQDKQEFSNDIDGLRKQLRDVERDILLKAPNSMGAGGGDIESAMRSRAVPSALKDKRNAIRTKIRELNASMQELGTSNPSEATQQAIDAIKSDTTIPSAEKIRLTSELRQGKITPEDVKAVVGEVETKPKNTKTAKTPEDSEQMLKALQKAGYENRTLSRKENRVTINKEAIFPQDRFEVDVELKGDKWTVFEIGVPDGMTGEQIDAMTAFREALAELNGESRANQETNSLNDKDNAENDGSDLNKNQENIDDFGEKLEGARKDMVRAMAKEYSDDEIASLPLSKLWPLSDVDLILNSKAAAIAFAARSEIPSKPRTPHRVRAWVEKVKQMRGIGRIAFIPQEEIEEWIKKGRENYPSLDKYFDKVELLSEIDRKQWKRIESVAIYPDAYIMKNGVKENQSASFVKIDGRTVTFNTVNINELADLVKDKLQGDVSEKRMAFEVRGRKGSFFINKKGDKDYTQLKTFDDSKKAFSFIKDNYDELVGLWDEVKDKNNVKKSDVRKAENKPRTGEDYRKGKDVTPKMFDEAFGFRGVQFGEWVRQGGKDSERQGALNSAYDGLMDLANIVGVPPKALSLEGTLGLAFGARGKSKASAHFETDKLVINLTKTKGAGSLAHEWFHALDNYFSRKRGYKSFGDVGSNQLEYRKENYITYKPEKMYVRNNNPNGTRYTKAELKRYSEGSRAGAYWNMSNFMLDPKHPEGVRPEVEARFADLVNALNESPMKKRAFAIDGIRDGKGDGYWSRIIEMGARSFENYVIQKMQLNGYDNDYLANVVNIQDFARDKARFPYLLPEELAPIEAAFDNLFAEIKTKETDNGNVALFSRANEIDAPIFFSQLSKAIESAKQDTMPASQWRLWLQSNAAKLGVKKDEIQWTGITDWLELQGKEKVNKADIQAYLDGNGVQVEETMLGTENEIDVENPDTIPSDLAQLFDDVENGEFSSYDLPNEAEKIGYLVDIDLGGEITSVSRIGDANSPTKYSKYTVEGGENYKELLLTLPAQQFDPIELKKARDELEKHNKAYNPKTDYYDQDTQSPTPWAKKDKELRKKVAELEKGTSAEAKKSGASGRRDEYKSSHFDQPNILAHVRFDERTDADGKRVIFIQELQSDFGQEGKRNGFKLTDEELINLKGYSLALKVNQANKEWRNDSSSKEFQDELWAEIEAEKKETGINEKDIMDAQKAIANNQIAVPKAPFVTDTKAWVSLATKRMMRYAVDNGFSKVAFINGKQAGDLYSLAKQVDELIVEKLPDGTFNIKATMPNGGGMQDIQNEVRDSELENIIGKDLAKKVINQDYGTEVYDGVDLEVGNEGMKAFYDQIVPQVVNDVLKKVGGRKVESVEITDNIENIYRNTLARDGLTQSEIGFMVKRKSKDEMKAALDNANIKYNQSKQTAFTITPEMREKVASGLPLFNRERSEATSNLILKSVEKQVSDIKKGWNNAPEIIVVNDMNDKRIPENVRIENERQLSQGATGEPEGFYLGGKVYLVANQLNSKADVARVLFHESLGHYGLRGLYGADLGKVLDQVSLLRKKEVIQKARDYGQVGLDKNGKPLVDVETATDAEVWAAMTQKNKQVSAEEVLAELAQTKPEIGFVKRAIATIRQWLRENAPYFKAMKLSDNDIINNFILPARNFVERGGREQNNPSELKTAYSLTQSTKDTFENRVDELFAKKATLNRSQLRELKVLDTGDVLDVVGFGNMPVYVNEAHAIDDGQYNHPLTKEQWKKMPEWLDNPALVLERAKDGNITIIAPEKTKDGKAIIIGLKPEVKQDRFGNPDRHLVLTAYPKDRGLMNLNRQLESGDMKPLYVNTKIASAYYRGSGLNYAAQSDSLRSYNRTLKTDRDLVKYRANNSAFARSNQIKSAIGNNGNFDGNNDDIRFSRQGRLNPEWQSLDEQSMMDDVIRYMQDKYVDLKRVTQEINKANGDIADRWDAYLQEELYHGRTAKRVQDFINKDLKPLIEDMRMRGVGMADFEEYLWMRHAPERNAQIAEINEDMPDGGSGIKTAEAEAYMETLTPADKKKYEALAKRIDAINRKSRQALVDYGLESPETIAAWEAAYENYVPLMREDMERGTGNGTGTGFKVKGNSTKRALGSNRAVVDIIGNIAQQYEKNIIRGEKNRVATALVGLAKLNPKDGFWSVDTPPTIRHVSKATGLVEMRTDPNYKNRNNVIVARIPDKNGRIQERSVVFDEFDDRAMKLALSINNLDVDQVGKVTNFMGAITRYFSSINTQYNPIFGVINITRDTQGALLNLTTTELAGKQKEVMKNIMPALRGIYADTRTESGVEKPMQFGSFTKNQKAEAQAMRDLWEEYQREGGTTGFRDMYANAEDRSKSVEKALDPEWWTKTIAGKVVSINGVLTVPESVLKDKAIKPVFDWLSDYNQTLENAVRLAAYKTAIDSGISKQRAASLGKNLTVNFNRKGTITRQAGAWFAFLNAATQGTARIGETLTGPKGKQIIAGGISIGVAQAVMLAAMGFDEDEPPKFVRSNNFIIPLPGTDKKYVTIPMPLGFNVLPNFGRIATELVIRKGADATDSVFEMFGAVMESFNPLGGNGRIDSIIMPTAFDPFNDLSKNEDWTGRAISQEDFSGLRPTPGYTRTRDKTWSGYSEVARWINNLSGGDDYEQGRFSPTGDQIDYLVGQVTGGVGREISKSATTAEAIATGEDLPMYKIPLVGRFYGETKGQAPQSAKFYNNLTKINKIDYAVKARYEAGEDYQEYINENPEFALVEFGKKAYSAIRKARKYKEQLVEKSASREKVKEIDETITGYMQQFNDEMDKIKESATKP